jgi:aspartate-semialdehyde dehydrogenase
MEISPWKGRKIPVALLGATGSVGQRFVTLLVDHPWFEIAALTASGRSAGKSYGEAVQWAQASPLPAEVAALRVQPTNPAAAPDCPLVFSALDADVAGEAERAFADAGRVVVSNARNHRLEPSVPLVVPEINADHLDLVDVHRRDGSSGAIVTNPNCSTIGLVMALKPLHDAFGVRTASVVTMQAVSGAGLPGISSLQILDNLVPYIVGEEEKMEAETRKILGRLENGRIAGDTLTISAQCNRIPVTDGHTLCVSVGLERETDLASVRRAFEGFSSEASVAGLPSAPEKPIHYMEAPDAPQPRLHREVDRGMAIMVGRLRPCPLASFKFVVLSHNTLRGAAGGALLLAELVVARGLVPGVAGGGELD